MKIKNKDLKISRFLKERYCEFSEMSHKEKEEMLKECTEENLATLRMQLRAKETCITDNLCKEITRELFCNLIIKNI